MSITSLISEFQANSIDARSFFWPLSSLSFFQSNKKNNVSRDIPKRAINLPSFFDMSENQLIKICKIIEKNISKK